MHDTSNNVSQALHRNKTSIVEERLTNYDAIEFSCRWVPGAYPPSRGLHRSPGRAIARRAARTVPSVSTATGSRIPGRYRQLTPVTVRYAPRDLAHVTLIDEPTGASLSPRYPLERVQNADARRRRSQPVALDAVPAEPPPSGIAP